MLVVPTPSLYTPSSAREFSKVGMAPKIPIDPVIVLVAAQISSAGAAIQ